MSASVIGDPHLADRIHVVEGLADALAVASREGRAGRVAVVAASGTAWARLAGPLAALGAPVVCWPDGDGAGRSAATNLTDALQDRGAIVRIVPIPDGHDPAMLVGHDFDGRGRWRIPPERNPKRTPIPTEPRGHGGVTSSNEPHPRLPIDGERTPYTDPGDTQ